MKNKCKTITFLQKLSYSQKAGGSEMAYGLKDILRMIK
jgi:hypothetical protein